LGKGKRNKMQRKPLLMTQEQKQDAVDITKLAKEAAEGYLRGILEATTVMKRMLRGRNDEAKFKAAAFFLGKFDQKTIATLRALMGKEESVKQSRGGDFPNKYRFKK
jgi:hypothetical protein